MFFSVYLVDLNDHTTDSRQIWSEWSFINLLFLVVSSTLFPYLLQKTNVGYNIITTISSRNKPNSKPVLWKILAIFYITKLVTAKMFYFSFGNIQFGRYYVYFLLITFSSYSAEYCHQICCQIKGKFQLLMRLNKNKNSK